MTPPSNVSDHASPAVDAETIRLLGVREIVTLLDLDREHVAVIAEQMREQLTLYADEHRLHQIEPIVVELVLTARMHAEPVHA